MVVQTSEIFDLLIKKASSVLSCQLQIGKSSFRKCFKFVRTDLTKNKMFFQKLPIKNERMCLFLELQSSFSKCLKL